MKLRLLALGVIVAALALAARPARAQLLSPGPLSAPHADLDGDDDCGKCHSSGKQVDAGECLKCHKDLSAKIASNRGLHGRAYKGQACENCHVEHNGRGYHLVRWPGGAPEKLNHDDTGWKLVDTHATTTCAKCHTQKTPGGRATFLAARTDCGACHKDEHQGRLGAACQQCHNARKFTEVSITAFDHGKSRYPLSGAHKTVECAKCHGTPAKYAPLPFARCDNCHKDPHDGQFEPKPCTKCHEISSWATADAAFSKSHPQLSLGGGHAKVKCAKCHDQGNAKPPSKGNTCVACHPVIHEAKFGNKCDQCHKAIRWSPLARDVELAAHDKTVYPLTDKHLEVPCAKCHDPKQPANTRYRKLAFATCASCHSDPHAGEMAKLGSDCTSCHTLQGFSPTTFTVADHGKTAFALDGRHAVTPCGGCHGGGALRVDLHVGKTACAACHDNPHGEQFAAEMNVSGCGKCHTSASWQQAQIDHTTFPLVGAHATTACERCHGTVAKGLQPAAFRGVPRTCEGCHEDPHAAQFRTSEPKKACAQCHTEAQHFKRPDFDHAKETGYQLEGKHAQVACAKCHPSEQLRNGATAVRYRLGYRACKDCHANPHGAGL